MSRIGRATIDDMLLIQRKSRPNWVGSPRKAGRQDCKRPLIGTVKTLSGSIELEAAPIEVIMRSNMEWRQVRIENSRIRIRRDGWACGSDTLCRHRRPGFCPRPS